MHRQTTIPITLAAKSTLLSVEAARAMLGVDEDSVLSLIEHGELRWAWDISLRSAKIREVRIWAECVAARQNRAPQPGDSLDAVLPDVIGVRERERVTATYVRDRLLCSQQHIERLVSLGVLRGHVVDRTRWVETRSLYEFLTSRILT